MRLAITAPSIFLLTTLCACNMTKFAADQTADVLQVAAPGLAMENDVVLAREAAPGSLKTVEGFLLASPDNKKIIKILAQGYCEYTFGFLHDDIERLTLEGKSEEAEPIAKRATGLFLRCMNYGMRLLGKDWERAMYSDIPTLEKKLKKAGKGDVPGLFFTALGLASAIDINREDIELVALAPKAVMIFERIVQLDEKYYNGGAHMALGMYYTSRGRDIGGDPERGKKHFERAIKLTGGKFLMPKVLYAANYGPISGNQKLFHDTLTEVLRTSPAIWPEQRLPNELAHIRARRYLAHEKEYF